MYVVVLCKQYRFKGDVVLKLLPKNIRFVISAVGAGVIFCLGLIILGATIMVTETKLREFNQYRETVKVADIRYRELMNRKDCYLFNRSETLNQAEFKCAVGYEVVWIP